MADLQDEQYIYVETRKPGPAEEEHVPPPPLIAPHPYSPHSHLLSRNNETHILLGEAYDMKYFIIGESLIH